MNQLAIDISIALVSDERLIIDPVVGTEPVEGILAEIIEKVLQKPENKIIPFPPKPTS